MNKILSFAIVFILAFAFVDAWHGLETGSCNYQVGSCCVKDDAHTCSAGECRQFAKPTLTYSPGRSTFCAGESITITSPTVSGWCSNPSRAGGGDPYLVSCVKSSTSSDGCGSSGRVSGLGKNYNEPPWTYVGKPTPTSWKSCDTEWNCGSNQGTTGSSVTVTITSGTASGTYYVRNFWSAETSYAHRYDKCTPPPACTENIQCDMVLEEADYKQITIPDCTGSYCVGSVSHTRSGCSAGLCTETTSDCGALGCVVASGLCRVCGTSGSSCALNADCCSAICDTTSGNSVCVTCDANHVQTAPVGNYGGGKCESACGASNFCDEQPPNSRCCTADCLFKTAVCSNPPTASITGPTTGTVGSSLSYTGSYRDDIGLSKGEILVATSDKRSPYPYNCLTGVIVGSWCTIKSQALSGLSGTVSGSWVPSNADSYLVIVRAEDNGGSECSGESPLPLGVEDCGNSDSVSLTVSGAAGPPACPGGVNNCGGSSYDNLGSCTGTWSYPANSEFNAWCLANANPDGYCYTCNPPLPVAGPVVPPASPVCTQPQTPTSGTCSSCWAVSC